MSRSTALTALVILQISAIGLALYSTPASAVDVAAQPRHSQPASGKSAIRPRAHHTPLPKRPIPNYKDPNRYAPFVAKTNAVLKPQFAARPIDLTILPRSGVPAPRSFIARSAGNQRSTVATTTTLSPSTTGIWPWWTYDTRAIPGVGTALANVANLNFLFLETDVAIPGSGPDLAFERVYNSQSGHDASNDDGSTPSVYGNRWTNNLDVHLGWTSTGSNIGTVSVYTADGARDDYGCETDTAATCTSSPGIHDLLATTQVTGGVACQLQWTLKSGVSYIFNAPYPACNNGVGQYGRLLAIYGRNSSFFVQLSYSWNPDASDPENIAQILVTHQPDNTQLILTFGQVNTSPKTTELLRVTRPDLVTINYHYASNGDLSDVDKPRNTPVLPSGETVPTSFLDGAPIAPGNVPETYGRQVGDIEVCGPRAAISIIDTNQQPTDGACVDFDFNPTTHQIFDWYARGVLNPTPGDNVSPSPIQTGESTAFTQWDETFFGLFSLICSATTDVSDVYNHDTQWCPDTTGRVTEVSRLEGAGTYITTTQSWDSDNNLKTVTDARGYMTNMAYDANGNVAEVSLPSQLTSQGTLRPTSLFDYDSHNNLLNYCDPANNSNNTWNPSPGPTPCSGSGSTSYMKYTYSTADANEPYGCVATNVTPSGYTTQVTYSAVISPPHPCNVGLPYQIKPGTYVQADGMTRNAMQTFTYGTAGNVRTYTKNYPNNATWQINYTQDGMHQVYSVADPDGVTSYRCYNLDESVFYSESPIQNKFDQNFPGGPPCPSPSPLISGATPPPFAAAYGYDADGSVVTELHHHDCTNPNASPAPTPCPASSVASTKCYNAYPAGGTACNYYDGLDRLVEVKQPYQKSVDIYKNPWITRYLYDLDGAPKSFKGNSFHAFGNLFTTQELLPSTATVSATAPIPTGAMPNNSYIAIKGTAYDGLDRTQAQFSTAGGSSIISENLIWDSTPINGDNITGLLGQICNSMMTSQCEQFDYYPDGEVLEATSSDLSSPERDYTYDPDGRATKIVEAGYANPQTYVYDVNGALQSSKDAGSVSDRATLTHNRYPDGVEESLDVAGPLSQTGLFTYSYRNDGPLQTEVIDDTNVANIFHNGQTTLAYRYTDAGRLAGRTETGAAALPSPSPQTTVLYQTGPATGLVSEQDTPVGNLNSFTYTAESEIAQVTSAGSQVCSSPTTTYGYTVRGELRFSPQCPTGTATVSREANGLALHVSSNSGQQYTWNPALGVIVDILGTSLCGTGSSAPTCESYWLYDPAGRMASQQAPYPVIDVNQNNVPATHTYDAENHLLTTELVRPTSSPLWETTAWGPDGHPIQIGTHLGTNPDHIERLHWNGDQLLFTNQSSGEVLDDIKVDVQGDILPGDNGYKGLTFYDRGPGGTILGCHNKTGTTYVGLTDSWLGTPTMPCAVSSSPPQMPISTLWQGTPYGGSIGLGTGLTIGMPRTDGFVDGLDTIQGTRAYDNTGSLWMTPDAYQGIDTDPATQKSYMWNGNNPLVSRDPTGFFTCNGCGGGDVQSQNYNIIWFPPGPPTNTKCEGDVCEGSSKRPLLYTIAHVTAHRHPPVQWCNEESTFPIAPQQPPQNGASWSGEYQEGLESGRNYYTTWMDLVPKEASYNLQYQGPFARSRPPGNFGLGVFGQSAGWTPDEVNAAVVGVALIHLHPEEIPKDILLAQEGFLWASFNCPAI